MKREFDGYNVCNWCSIGIVLVCILAACLNAIFKKEPTSTPVEKNEIVDSLKQANEVLIIEINNLDSVKNVKAIEVKSLDNDSTLKLFYKLISK